MSIRRQAMLLVVGASVLLAACGGSAERGWSSRDIAASQEDAPFFPILANSPLGLGPNRLAVALTEDGALRSGASVTVRVYRLADEPEDSPNESELLSEQQATQRSITISDNHIHADGTTHVHEGPQSSVYVANVDLNATGWWGIEVDVELDGERYEQIRLSNTWVRESTEEPAIGAPVPRSEQLTLRDVDDISEIDSSVPPNPDLHDLTIAEALETGKPVVVAFVTPAFCQTRFCGPVMEEVILPSMAEYGDVAEFVHVEPFDLAAAREGTLVSVPTANEWRLRSEPFIFVLNPDGTVAAKFEGIMEAAEVNAALDAVLSG